MITFDDDLWPRVKNDVWKYRRRREPPTLIELHATRSGIAGRTPAQEYSSTINWFLSASNIVRVPGDDWASMASYIVGGGKVCRVLDPDFYPHYSLGHADPIAFSIEIGQNLADTPFDQRDLENAARICAELSAKHDIPVKVLPYLDADNRQAPGYVRHDRSANGDVWGKSDPGPLFDDRAFEALVRSFMEPPTEEDDMTTYKLAQQWQPYPMTWIIAFLDDTFPIYKRHILYPATVEMLKGKLGEPLQYTPDQLATIPRID